MFALSVKHSCFKATGQIWVLISIMNQEVLFIFTLWLDIQDKANIWNCPCSSRRIMVGKGKFTIMAMVDPHKNQFLMGGFLWASCSWNESLTSVLKTKDTAAHILHLLNLSCLAITLLDPAQRPCMSPMDSWASGAWRGSGGRCRRERGGQNPRRRKRRTRRSSIRSRSCPRSRSCAWLTDASPPVRWRNTVLQMRRTCQQVWGDSLFLCLYRYMIPPNRETPR